MNNELYHYHGGLYSNELYHYGIPGMKWGQRKAKLQSAAKSYRTAAGGAKNSDQANRYRNKAKKLEKKAAALDTSKGRLAYNAKKGAAITAGVLTGLGALYISNFKGWQMGKETGVTQYKKLLKEAIMDSF